MSLSAAQFMIDRPEFASAGTQLVASAIAEATKELDVRVWGNVYDTALSLTVAHKLWSSPFGVSLRLDGDSEEDESRYLKERARLRLARIPRITVL